MARAAIVGSALLAAATNAVAGAALSISVEPELTVQAPLKLTISGVPGVYTVEYAPSLEEGAEWRPLRIVRLADTPSVVYDGALLDSTATYFRVSSCDECTNVPVNPDPDRLVWIPPGSLMMGSPEDEADRFSWEGPQTLTTLTQGFWMTKYEVTQREFVAVMGTNPSHFVGDDNLPVDHVSREAAVNYCAALTQQERTAGRIPPNSTYRLPTEAEWEYACRADTTTRFSYGDDPDYSQASAYAWFDANSGGKTQPVGQKLPNPWGLYDMHGNVWEWCLDWWDWNLTGGLGLNPVGPDWGLDWVIRGGDWALGPDYCRSASRYGSSNPVNSGIGIGFRVVLDPGE